MSDMVKIGKHVDKGLNPWILNPRS